MQAQGKGISILGNHQPWNWGAGQELPPMSASPEVECRGTLAVHDVPQKPWHTLGSALFYWNTGNYLLVIDYYSKFPVVKKLTNIHSSAVLAHLKSIFEEHGFQVTW